MGWAAHHMWALQGNIRNARDTASVLQCLMYKHARHGQPRLRYEAAPRKRSGERAWMVYDILAWRLIALSLHQHEARTLAHTLNVADLGVPPMDFGDHS